jgi:hypothetical protein
MATIYIKNKLVSYEYAGSPGCYDIIIDKRTFRSFPSPGKDREGNPSREIITPCGFLFGVKLCEVSAGKLEVRK